MNISNISDIKEATHILNPYVHFLRRMGAACHLNERVIPERKKMQESGNRQSLTQKVKVSFNTMAEESPGSKAISSLWTNSAD